MRLIPITESLPEENQDVIGYNGKRLVAAKYVKRNYFNTETKGTEYRGVFEVEKYPGPMDRAITSTWMDITHWMPAQIDKKELE